MTTPTPRQEWTVMAIMALVVLVVDWAWYQWLRPHPELKPLFLVGITVVFFVVTGSVARAKTWSRDSLWVIGAAVLLLSALVTFGTARTFARHLAEPLRDLPAAPLHGFLYFAACSLMLRMLLPYLVAKRILGFAPTSMGYRPRVARTQLLIYLVIVALMVPVVAIASADPAFQAKYPQAKGVIVDGELALGWFFIYQLAYLLVFVSGESFWRGFILFGLERDLGRLGLCFMASLYSVAHFGKPVGEAWGALLTGYVLGWIALRYRNFWLGVAIHWSVALTMDLAVLLRRGLL